MADQHDYGVAGMMQSTRSKLMITYFCSMLGLSLLNICVSVIPSRLSDNDTDMLFTLISQMVCMGLIPVVGALLGKRKEPRTLPLPMQLARSWRYHLPTNPLSWLVVIPLAVSFYFTTQLMARINALYLTLTQFTYPVGPGTIYPGFGDLLKWIALGALLPAVFEELTHRGLLLDALADRGNEIEMVIWSGLMFGAMHTNIMQFFYAFVGGMVFAFIVIKTNSIYPAMLLHFCNNAFSHIESYAAQHPTGAFRWIATVSDFFSGTLYGTLLAAVLLVANMVLSIWLISTLQRVCGKPEGLREKWIFRSKKSTQFAISMDAYRPYGKATLVDNLFLYGTFAMTMCMTIFTHVWGIMR